MCVCVCVCDSVPILCSSVLALHELTEKVDCVLPVENQVRGIEGGGEEVGGRRRWGRGWEEEVGPGVVGRGGAGGGRKRLGGEGEANSSKRSVEYANMRKGKRR